MTRERKAFANEAKKIETKIRLAGRELAEEGTDVRVASINSSFSVFTVLFCYNLVDRIDALKKFHFCFSIFLFIITMYRHPQFG